MENEPNIFVGDPWAGLQTCNPRADFEAWKRRLEYLKTPEGREEAALLREREQIYYQRMLATLAPGFPDRLADPKPK